MLTPIITPSQTAVTLAPGSVEQDRRHDRHHHHGDFDEVEEEAENEDHRHDDDELAPEAARQAGQEVA